MRAVVQLEFVHIWCLPWLVRSRLLVNGRYYQAITDIVVIASGGTALLVFNRGVLESQTDSGGRNPSPRVFYSALVFLDTALKASSS